MQLDKGGSFMLSYTLSVKKITSVICYLSLLSLAIFLVNGCSNQDSQCQQNCKRSDSSIKESLSQSQNTEDVRLVLEGELAKYWVYTGKSQNAKVLKLNEAQQEKLAAKKVSDFLDTGSKSGLAQSATETWVKVGIVINDSGKVEMAEILQSMPNNHWNDHALALAKEMVFEKAENSQLNHVIYTTWTFNFSLK